MILINLKNQSNDTIIVCKPDFNTIEFNEITNNINETELSSNDISIIAKPSDTMFLIIKRKDKSFSAYSIFANEFHSFGKNCMKFCKTKKQKNDCKDNCFIANIIRDMDSTLFQQIDGITDVYIKNDRKRFGHLILFNINGNPMFCVIEFKKYQSNFVIFEYFSENCLNPLFFFSANEKI